MSDREVCYGALYEGAAKVLGKISMSNELSDTRSDAPLAHFCVQAIDHFYALYSENGVMLAVLDTRSASKLTALKDTPMIRFEAVLHSSVFTKRQRRNTKQSQSFPVSINIFGPESAADEAACRLSEVHAYLQHPESLLPEVKYHNPQFLTFANEDLNMSALIGTVNNSGQDLQINVAEEISRLLESLTDVAIGASLESPVGLISKLKKHQEDGLHFILQREDETFSRQFSEQIRQVIAIQTKEPPSMLLGGLIADMMGLGKTLTMLAAILHSMSAAEDFGTFFQSTEDECANKVFTKATLVVVSSAQLLESWESEIKAHIYPGALTFIRFHGYARPRDPDILRSVDLVLTTYATLAADHAAQSVLYQMEWYRVVLDEAHWIRNSGSKQFRAAASLHTRRRWCLTGTPIQNKLDDLTSLAQFLQLPPLSTRVEFQKQILGPLSEGGPNFTKALRTYLEAYCLRRSQKCLTLPAAWQEDVILPLSFEEQHLYNMLFDETRRQLDSLVSKGDTIRCNILFRAMLRMRRLCNLGTFSPVETSTDLLRKLDSEIKCVRCSATDDDTLMLLANYLFCPDCGRQLDLASPLPNPVDNQGSDAENSCEKASTIREVAQVPSAKITHLPLGGYSTKLAAVVQNVVSKGPEAKNIIFSCWTSTLDILSQLFRQQNIPHCQLDGRVSYAERSERLKAFKEDPRVIVLLMSIETGSLGLNLTIANRVHIVEPQWNPSVEEQAIARALRMGQTREVTTIRYSMENTVEQNIKNLQQKKKRLAKFTFDTNAQDTLSETLEDLKSVLSMGSN